MKKTGECLLCRFVISIFFYFLLLKKDTFACLLFFLSLKLCFKWKSENRGNSENRRGKQKPRYHENIKLHEVYQSQGEDRNN